MESALAVLTALQPFLPPTNITQHAKWARKVCISGLNDAASVPLTKTLLTLYLKLSRRAELDLEAVRCLCFVSFVLTARSTVRWPRICTRCWAI